MARRKILVESLFNVNRRDDPVLGYMIRVKHLEFRFIGEPYLSVNALRYPGFKRCRRYPRAVETIENAISYLSLRVLPPLLQLFLFNLDQSAQRTK